MRFPSKGIGLVSGCRRGSAMTFFMPSSRTLREGHVIQEKTTVSLSLRLTAMGNDVTLPSDTSSPQHSTSFNAPCSLNSGFCMFLVDFAIGGWVGSNKPSDIDHDISPHLAGRPAQPKIQRRHSNVSAVVDHELLPSYASLLQGFNPAGNACLLSQYAPVGPQSREVV